MSALKFTPRDVEITLAGYGGEIVIGRISEAAYDYWEGREDLGDYAYDWSGEFDEVPADANFCPDGCWHDVDDICHESGCELSESCWITVDDLLESQTVFESNLDLDNLASKGVDTQAHTHYRPNENEPDGTCVFLGQSFEKGTFFSGTVRITQPFDPKKLSITWTDCDGWRIISGVDYDGEEVEGFDGYSTSGKSTHFQVYRVERDDEEWDPVAELDKIRLPVLEGEETWSSRMIDEHDEVERWEGHELTPWWQPQDVPVREGRYQVLLGKWPFPSFAEYTKKRGWRQYDEPVENLTAWRGLAQPVG